MTSRHQNIPAKPFQARCSDQAVRRSGGQRSAVSGQRLAVSGQQSASSGQAVSGQRSAVSGQAEDFLASALPCSLVLSDQCRLYLLSLSISMSNSLIIMLLELFSSSHTTEAYKSIIGIKHSDANFHSLDVFEKAVNSCSAAQNAANGVSGAQTAAQKSENSVWRMQ